MHENRAELGQGTEQLRVRIPLSVSIPTAESKAGLLKSYTCYCMKVCGLIKFTEFL